MNTKLVAVDVDPEKGVMLRLDFTFYTDTLDCIVYLLFHPNPKAHVRYNLLLLPCMIRSAVTSMYDTICCCFLV